MEIPEPYSHGHAVAISQTISFFRTFRWFKIIHVSKRTYGVFQIIRLRGILFTSTSRLNNKRKKKQYSASGVLGHEYPGPV